MGDHLTMARQPGQARKRRARLALVLVLVVLLLMLAALAYAILRIVVLPTAGSGSTVAAPADMQWVRSIYAYGPGADQRMNSPVAVVVSDDGAIWSVDTQTNMVMAFNPDGTVRKAVNLIEVTGATMPHLGPKSIALGENDEVYIGAYMGQAIYTLNRDLGLIDGFEIGTRPYAIVEDEGTLLISTSEGIVRYTTDGEKVGMFAPRGRGDGEVDLPQAMTLTDDGILYVADSMNGRVDAFERDGTFLWRTGFGAALQPGAIPSEEASNTSEFQVPTGIAMDGAGRLVVSDMQQMEFFILDADDGSVIERHGTFGYEDGEVIYPMGLAYDAGRDWFVSADMGNARLQILRFPGSAPANLATTVRRNMVGPVWVCCLPPALLFILVALAAFRRRTQHRSQAPGDETPPHRMAIDEIVWSA